MNESAATTDADQLRDRGWESKTREGEQAFDWVAAELAALDATQTDARNSPPVPPA